MFIDEQTTADEAPNGVLRFVLALAGADPRILTDGTCVGFLSKFFWIFSFLDLHARSRHGVGASCPNPYPDLEILTLKSSTEGLEEEGPETFEAWCTTEEFGATMRLIRQELLGLN